MFIKFNENGIAELAPTIKKLADGSTLYRI